MAQTKYTLLQLFADGADGSGAAPAAEGTTGASTPAAAGQDIDAEFEALVAKGGKYADAFARKAQASFDQRYKGFKATEKKAARLERFAQTVAGDYKVDAADVDALEDAYLSDARRFAEKSAETGRSAEDLAKEDRMSRKLKEYEEREKRENAQKAQEAEARRFYDSLVRQEAAMRKQFPDFRLDRELEDQTFRLLVKSGAKLEDAYFAVHHAELMAQTASDAKNATLASVAAKGSRPAEAAASSATPTPAKVDYSKMPRADFMKLWNS